MCRRSLLTRALFRVLFPSTTGNTSATSHAIDCPGEFESHDRIVLLFFAIHETFLFKPFNAAFSVTVTQINAVGVLRRNCNKATFI